MRNLFIGLLIVAVVVVGGAFVANAAYQAGLSTAITTAAANAPDGTVVTPVAPGATLRLRLRLGLGPGASRSSGSSARLFLLFLLFGLLRAAFGRGRGWGGYGPVRQMGRAGRARPLGQRGDHDHRAPLPPDLRRLASRGARRVDCLDQAPPTDPSAPDVRDASRSRPPGILREGASVSLRCARDLTTDDPRRR